MKEPKRYAPYEMSDLDANLFEAAMAVRLANIAIQHLISFDKEAYEIPLPRYDRELIAFAVNEAEDRVDRAHAAFHEL